MYIHHSDMYIFQTNTESPLSFVFFFILDTLKRYKTMVNWFCFSASCFNNFKSKDSKGELFKYYRLPQDDKIKAEYCKLFPTTGIKWEKGHICSAHWSSGVRENTHHLPDVIVPLEAYEKIKQKYVTAKDLLAKYKTPNEKIKQQYKTAKRKYEIATEIINTPKPLKRTPVDRKHITSSRLTKPRTPSKKQYARKPNFSEERIKELEHKLEIANEKIKFLETSLQKTKLEVRKLKQTNIVNSSKLNNAKIELSEKKKKDFLYTNLVKQPAMFQHLCDLSTEQFELIFKCAAPYILHIPYPDCAGNSTLRKLDHRTDLFSVLTTCRHGLHQGVMSFMLGVSKATTQRIFIGWVIFLSTLFNKIDLKLSGEYLLKTMPDIFVKTGHGMTDLIIDATEFKFANATNYELNSLMFSHYKNTQTGKALIGISPNGGGMIFSEIYPGSISDSEITKKCGTIYLVQ